MTQGIVTILVSVDAREVTKTRKFASRFAEKCTLRAVKTPGTYFRAEFYILCARGYDTARISRAT